MAVMEAIKGGLKGWFGYPQDDDYDDEPIREDDYVDPDEHVLNDNFRRGRPGQYQNNGRNTGNVINLHSPNRFTSSVVICEPRDYDEEVMQICDHLTARRTITVSLEKTKDDATRRRILDFLMGAACAVNASMNKIAARVHILAPSDVELQQLNSGPGTSGEEFPFARASYR